MSSSAPWYKSYPDKVSKSIDLTQHPSIAALMQQSMKRFADRPAVTCLDTTISYGQLDQLSQSFAAFLSLHLGLKKGARIAIVLPNCIQFAIAFLGIQRGGFVAVNTNPMYTESEMHHQLKDAGVEAIIILDLFLEKLEHMRENLGIKHVVVTNIADQLPFFKSFFAKALFRIKGESVHPRSEVTYLHKALRLGAVSGNYKDATLTHDDLALLQYTGGTTGVAKGAMLTQANVLANMLQIKEWARPLVVEGEEVVLTAIPMYHIFSLSVNFLAFLALGCQQVLVPKPIPISNVVKIFAKYRITVMAGVNTLFNSMNHDKGFRALRVSSLKIAMAGGMPLQSAVATEFQKITGTPLNEGFGLTEASPCTHCNPLVGNHPVGSIGLPLPSTEARIVNDQGEDVPEGEAGELIVRGPQVMKGYWKRPDDTAQVLRDGWLYTGDIARMNKEGFFFVVDRKKDMILVSGFNVYPTEIEDVLMQHPHVLEAAVIGVKDDKSGEAVKAFVVAKQEGLTEQDLKGFCKERLTGYKVPRKFEFRTSLPKSNVGKILRKELRNNP